MARKQYVTRSVESTKLGVMVIDLNTGITAIKDYVVVGNLTKAEEKKQIKAIEPQLADSEKAVIVKSIEVETHKMGMELTQFMELAVLVDDKESEVK